MLKRRVTGIVLAVILMTLWAIQGWPLRLGLIVMMGLSMWEMYSAFVTHGAKPIRWIGMAYAVLVVPAYMMYGMQALMPLMALCCMLGLAGVIIRGEVDFDSAVATLFPLFYPGTLVTLLFPMMDMKPPLMATLAVGLAFLIAQMNDLFAYEIGVKFGKRKLSPVLSPKKTIEGSVAGIVASVAFSMLVPAIAELVVNNVPYFYSYQGALPPMWFFALMGLFGGVAGQVGDLTASMVKRYCGVKDFGSIFPGHGGMLDRIDSVLFTSVVVYIFLVVIWRG